MNETKVVEIPYKVDKPVYKDYTVLVPKFVDKQVDVPIGFDKVINDAVETIFLRLKSKILDFVDSELQSAISKRIKEVEVPKIIQKEEVVVKYTDILVDRAVIVDKPVTNAIITDKHVTNCIIDDVHVVNAVIEDVPVRNAVVEDVSVKNFTLVPNR